jgi:hypothetical protein
MPEKPYNRVEIFDLTLPDDRQAYEDLKNDDQISIVSQQEFAIGTGAVYRIVDCIERPKPKGEFDYAPPIC